MGFDFPTGPVEKLQMTAGYRKLPGFGVGLATNYRIRDLLLGALFLGRGLRRLLLKPNLYDSRSEILYVLRYRSFVGIPLACVLKGE